MFQSRAVTIVECSFVEAPSGSPDSRPYFEVDDIKNPLVKSKFNVDAHFKIQRIFR
jgi:hypothetical protein